ncbi:hypothetical protein [Pseudorhodoferax sp.]|uniref:hypothetical protein n=1 Tax=Pseudorhodoferax sp. TaxID=1993553 RepID=UPI0039E3C3CD
MPLAQAKSKHRRGFRRGDMPSTDIIERGKQVGVSTQLAGKDGIKWTSVRSQKVGDEYLMHTDVILEKNMTEKVHALDETRAFRSLQDAINGAERLLGSYKLILKITTLKGQRIFQSSCSDDSARLVNPAGVAPRERQPRPHAQKVQEVPPAQLA